MEILIKHEHRYKGGYKKILKILLPLLHTINQKIDLIMTKQEKFDAGLDRLNAATNEVAADMQKLKDDFAAGTLSEDSFSRFDQHIATLEALGADPANPIPEPTPGETGGTETGGTDETGNLGGEETV